MTVMGKNEEQAKELAAQIEREGFAVIAGTVGFLDVEAEDGTQLTDVLHHIKQAKKVRVIIVREDDGVEPHLKVQKAAADLTRWHRKAAQSLPLHIGHMGK